MTPFLLLALLAACHPDESKPGDSEPPDDSRPPGDSRDSDPAVCDGWPAPDPPVAGPAVGLARGDVEHASDLDEAAIEALVRLAVERAGGFEELVRGAGTVVLKPNLVSDTDSTRPNWAGVPLSPEVNGVTTDWRVTRAVARLVREIEPAAHIAVMEGSTGDTAAVMAALHYDAEHMPEVDEFVALETGSGGWQETDSKLLALVELPGGLGGTSFFMNRQYYEADVLISLPALKNHWNAVVTGAIKNVGIGATPANVYGISATLPVRTLAIDHTTVALHWWIHDFFLARPVDYAIMDGLQGVQNGPNPSWEVSGANDLSAEQMDMRLLLASPDSVALDTVEALLMTWDPASVEYLRLLGEDGAGQGDPAGIAVVGERVDEQRRAFAGVETEFASGGAVLADLAPPALGVLAAVRCDGVLRLRLDPGDAVRVELYAGGLLLGAWTGDLEEIYAELPAEAASVHDVQVEAFDAALNRSTAEAAIVDPGTRD